MKRTLHLANRLQEVLLNGHWIANTNYKEQLLGTNWQQATQIIGSLNSIAALTFHINYYLSGLIKVFNGGPLDIKDKYSFNLPPIQSATDWQQLVDAFINHSKQFTTTIEQMEETRLDEPFVEEKYGSNLKNIEGVIEHSYYHLGQIVLIKKLILEEAVQPS